MGNGGGGEWGNGGGRRVGNGGGRSCSKHLLPHILYRFVLGSGQLHVTCTSALSHRPCLPPKDLLRWEVHQLQEGNWETLPGLSLARRVGMWACEAMWVRAGQASSERIPVGSAGMLCPSHATAEQDSCPCSRLHVAGEKLQKRPLCSHQTPVLEQQLGLRCHSQSAVLGLAVSAFLEARGAARGSEGPCSAPVPFGWDATTMAGA